MPLNNIENVAMNNKNINIKLESNQVKQSQAKPKGYSLLLSILNNAKYNIKVYKYTIQKLKAFNMRE